MEHLLARLEIDSPPVGRRIVNIILNSYMPQDKEPEIQLARCVSLIQTNPGAARVFYRYASKHLSTANTGKFMVMLCRYILECVNKEVVKGGQVEEEDEEEKV
jgi:condensin-2 complex subunit G2